MRTLGSLTLCSSLLEAGLVDRFRVVVFPVITGSTGRDRIYDGYPDIALDMVASRTFDGRLQLLEYVPTVLTGPPGTSRLPDGRRDVRARGSGGGSPNGNFGKRKVSGWALRVGLRPWQRVFPHSSLSAGRLALRRCEVPANRHLADPLRTAFLRRA